jgi:ubiquinone/menaquinone biosynthesis C-methylase UbiE
VSQQPIRFDDGAAYESMMGIWSRLAGDKFLDWLAPGSGWRWIDVGCGNGAFTELLEQRTAPADVQGIDPSEGQLAYARTRRAWRRAEFRQGDAMALPFADRSFDAAIMALVIVFVPEPSKGVEEMVRVVRPGGTVATYMWDMLGGGFPLDPVLVEMKGMGRTPQRPPSVEASRVEALRQLWTGAGLQSVETAEIKVERTFADFEDFWTAQMKAPSLGPAVAAMAREDVETLRTRVRARLPSDGDGRITYGARANAIKGAVRS